MVIKRISGYLREISEEQENELDSEESEINDEIILEEWDKLEI